MYKISSILQTLVFYPAVLNLETMFDCGLKTLAASISSGLCKMYPLGIYCNTPL